MFNLKRWYTNRAIGTLILLLPVMGYLFYEAYLYRNREVVAEQALTAEVQSATFKAKAADDTLAPAYAYPMEKVLPCYWPRRQRLTLAKQFP